MEKQNLENAIDPRTYLCRLTSGNSTAMNAEIRLPAISYDDAIDKAIRAFRNDPGFNRPPVRARLAAYQVTPTGVEEEDAAFRFILPDEWE